jgi:tetratricopeptide (TPR) repeat protein
VEELADLRAQAWAALANSQRICGHLFDAEDSFAIAFRHAENGTGSSQIRVLLLSHLCSQRIFQRQLEAAVKLAVEAEEIAEEIGQASLQAAVMVRRGIALTYGGETTQAIDVFQQAIRMIDPEEDSYLLLAAHHNLVRCYIDLGRPDEALAIFYEARDLYQSCRDPLIVLRATWQEGQLLREVGHLRNAEAALLRARQGFEEQGLAYETAMVCLDLGDVYWKLGQLDELRRTLAQAVPIFRSLRVEREVLASLLRLQQAAGLEPSGPSE